MMCWTRGSIFAASARLRTDSRRAGFSEAPWARFSVEPLMTRPLCSCHLHRPHLYHTSEIKGRALQRMQIATLQIRAGKEKAGEKIGTGRMESLRGGRGFSRAPRSPLLEAALNIPPFHSIA